MFHSRFPQPGTRVIWLVALVFPVISSSTALAERPKLTLEEALTVLGQRSPAVAAARARHASALGESISTRTYPYNPTVSASTARREGAEGDSSDRGLELSQELELAGQPWKRARVSEAEAGAADSAYRVELQQLVAMVHVAFIEAVGARDHLDVDQRDLELATRLREIAEKRRDAGVSTDVDVLVARAAVGRAERRFQASKAAYFDFCSRLGSLIGLDRVPLPEGEPQDVDLPTVQEMVAASVERHPQLVAGRFERQASEVKVELARAALVPNLELTAFREREEGTDDITGLAVSLQIPVFDRGVGPRAVARAELALADAEEARLALMIEQEVRSASARRDASRVARDAIDREVIRGLRDGLRLLERSYETGKMGLADLVVMKRELLDGERDFVDVSTEYRLSTVELQLAGRGRERECSGREGGFPMKRFNLWHLFVALSLVGVLACAGSGDSHDHGEDHEVGHEDPHGEGHDDHDDDDDGHDDHGEELAPVELSEGAAAHANIRTLLVGDTPLSGVFETTGEVGFNEDHLVHVSPRISGRVDRVAASLGDRIDAGDVLAVLDSIELGQAKAELLQAQAREEVTRENLEREMQLLGERISSEREVAQARAEHREALATFETAKEKLRLFGLPNDELKSIRYGDPTAALLPIRAPQSGKVVEKHVVAGELVTPERELFTLADLDTVWIWVDIFEQRLPNVHLDDMASVRVDAHPERVFEGTVGYIRDQVDPHTRTVRARVDVPNPNGVLVPGMFARVVLTDPHREAAVGSGHTVVVPEAAIQREGEERIAFVQIRERTYEPRHLELGDASDGFVEVLAGIEPGEAVVVEGAFILRSEASKEAMGGGHSH